MSGRLDVVECELADSLDVPEDRRELARHPLGLLVVERQPRQLRDPLDLLAIDHLPESSVQTKRTMTV